MKIRLRRMSRLLSVAALSVALFSCADEEIVGGGPRVQEGLPAKIVLKVVSNENRIETRAAQPDENEMRVNNLYVFVFDEDGNVCKEGSGLYSNPNTTTDDNGKVTGNIVFTARSKNNAQIAGIANITTGNVNSTYELTENQLKEVKTKPQLLALLANLNEQTLERSSQFIMSGWVTDGKGNEIFNIPGSEDSEKITEFNCNLQLKRLDAKVEFIVKTEVPAEKIGIWKNFDFRPKDWRVVNVPAQSLVLPKTDGDTGGEKCEYFDTKEMPFEREVRDADYMLDTCSFVFYMPENRQTPVKSIKEAEITPTPEGGEKEVAARYALREKRDKAAQEPGDDFSSKPGQKYENGAFTYAPENATYVEMTGTLSYVDGEGYSVNANVKFTVHLGYVNADPDDYNTERNTHYTYTVTLRGVNDIVVEVTAGAQDDEREDRPGYEGDLIYIAEANLYNLDAHYERVLIHLDRSKAMKMTWGVRTPYNKAIYDIKGFENETEPGGYIDGANIEDENAGYGINDYRWIKFAINEDYGQTDPTKFVKYPGDHNYQGLDNGGTKSGYAPHPENARLLDVHQLIQRLRDDYTKKGLTTGTVAVTAFIDEYVYVCHPWDLRHDAKTNYLLGKWRDYVGAEDRLLYIIDGDNARFSPDGASSVMSSLLTFRQKSIRTVYDVANPNINSCWGLESRMEGDLVDVGSTISGGTSNNNGRLNTLRCLLGDNYDNEEVQDLRWTDVLNTADSYKLNDGHKDALHAVLMRNRDLNGDDYVQPSEIRWYLAAKDQLVDFYIGESALDDASHLYPVNPADRGGHLYWRYTTSTAYDGGQSGRSGAWGLYAEECVALAATSGMRVTELNNRFTYRCVRNLGIDLADPDTEPMALIPKVTSAESDGTYVIDCSNLSPKARRQSMETGHLPVHNDLSPYNRPYTKFQVATVDQDYPTPSLSVDFRGNESWSNDRDWVIYQNDENVTPSGFRVPNLRELLIMQTRLPREAWKTYQGRFTLISPWHYSRAMYLSYTTFSRGTYTTGGGDGTFNGQNGRPNKGGGFRFNAEENSIGATGAGTGGHEGYIRAVRDIQ